MAPEVKTAECETTRHDEKRRRKRHRSTNQPFFHERLHEAQHTLRPEDIYCDKDERNQSHPAERGELPEDDAWRLGNAKLVPVEAGQEPAPPPFKYDPKRCRRQCVQQRSERSFILPAGQKPGHQQEPHRRIKRQVEHEKKCTDGGNVADPPERAAKINQADQVPVTHRVTPRAFAAGDHPPCRHQRDPAVGWARKRREAGDEQQPRQGTPPPAIQVEPAIKHAPNCQEMHRTPMVYPAGPAFSLGNFFLGFELGSRPTLPQVSQSLLETQTDGRPCLTPMNAAFPIDTL